MAGKILFHYTTFNVGGAEMSLLRLMRKLVDRDWQVDLVLSTAGGSLEPRIDPRVNVIHLRDRVVGQRYKKEDQPLRKFAWALLDGLPFLATRLQWAARALRFRFQRYDAAVVSLQGMSPFFCCRCVRATTRLQWIRNDLTHCDGDGRAVRQIRGYHRHIDRFVCVSGSTYQSFVGLFPQVKDKAVLLYNIIDAEEVLSHSAMPNPYSDYGDLQKVVTVCRLSDTAKGLFRMLAVHNRLRSGGIDFLWFVVGDGPDREELAAAVRAKQMEDRFILLGQQDNPFPFYKHADISATLSYYEGLSGSVNEAKVMGKPVIATRFSGIEEQLSDGNNGLIVKNLEEAIYEGMKRLLTDNALLLRLTNDYLPAAIRDDEKKMSDLARLFLGNVCRQS